MGNVVFYQRQPRLMDVTTIGPVMPPGQHREKALGTLGFIPKEGHGQFSGDLYSMGKLLYLLLIRKTDEACPLELKQSDLEALGRHHREPPEFIAALATVVAGACGVTVTTKAGEPKPSPYGRADEMIRDLESAMDLRTQRLRER
jgi:hypothetical protein